VRVLVTGGSGQLGSLVIERLLRREDVESVAVLDRRRPAERGPRQRWLELDLVVDELTQATEGVDVVFHFAALVLAGASLGAMRRVNVEGTLRVWEAARRAGVKRFIQGSSIAAYGLGPGLAEGFDESTPLRPTPWLPYAQSKYEAEVMLDALTAAAPRGPSLVRLRPGVLVGAGTTRGVGALWRGRRMMVQSGAPRQPLVWDEDVADAALLAVDSDAQGAFNLLAAEQVSHRALCDAAGLRLVEVPRPLGALARGFGELAGRLGVHAAADPRWLGAQRTEMAASCERARSVLGWSPVRRTCVEVMAAWASSGGPA